MGSKASSLRDTFRHHQGNVTDKWSFYLEEWDQIFDPIRHTTRNILEIGVRNGGSLDIWSSYFTNVENVIGCDIEEKCKEIRFPSQKIHVVIGDINVESTKKEISKFSDQWNIIIDDGSHHSDDTIKSFMNYFPLLADNGIYIIEDLHTSYWLEFNGGLNNPRSSMAFFKRLTDILNHEHWRNNKFRTSIIKDFLFTGNVELTEKDLSQIHSIEFLNSLCVVKKRQPESNELGRRIIVGTIENVAKGQKKYHNTSINDYEAVGTDDENLDIFRLIDEMAIIKEKNVSLTLSALESDYKIETLTNDAEAHNICIKKLESRLTEYQHKLKELTKELNVLKKIKLDLEVEIVNNLKYAKELEQQLGNNKIQIDNLQEEVVSYASSRIWQITRPLRKARNLAKRK